MRTSVEGLSASSCSCPVTRLHQEVGYYSESMPQGQGHSIPRSQNVSRSSRTCEIRRRRSILASPTSKHIASHDSRARRTLHGEGYEVSTCFGSFLQDMSNPVPAVQSEHALSTIVRCQSPPPSSPQLFVREWEGPCRYKGNVVVGLNPTDDNVEEGHVL